MASLRTEMDRLFESLVRDPLAAMDWPFIGRGRLWPTVDLAESPEEVTVRAELPGIDPNDLDVTITGNQLVLSGEKKEVAEKEGQGYYHSESRFGTFRRTVPLPEWLDTQNVAAEYVNGVLTLRIKRSPTAAPKRIEIKVKS